LKRQLVIVGFLILFVCVESSGCKQESKTIDHERTRFIGTWQNTMKSYIHTMSFFSDGICVFRNYTETWELTEGKLVINISSISFSSN